MQKSCDKACLGLCQFRSLQGSGERQQGFASGWFPVQRIMQGRQGSPFATSTRMQGTRALALLYLHQIKGSKAGIHPQRRMEGFDYATPSFRSINATLSRPEITSYGCAMGHPHRLLTCAQAVLRFVLGGVCGSQRLDSTCRLLLLTQGLRSGSSISTGATSSQKAHSGRGVDTVTFSLRKVRETERHLHRHPSFARREGVDD